MNRYSSAPSPPPVRRSSLAPTGSGLWGSAALRISGGRDSEESLGLPPSKTLLTPPPKP